MKLLSTQRGKQRTGLYLNTVGPRFYIPRSYARSCWWCRRNAPETRKIDLGFKRKSDHSGSYSSSSERWLATQQSEAQIANHFLGRKATDHRRVRNKTNCAVGYVLNKNMVVCRQSESTARTKFWRWLTREPTESEQVWKARSIMNLKNHFWSGLRKFKVRV